MATNRTTDRDIIEQGTSTEAKPFSLAPLQSQWS